MVQQAKMKLVIQVSGSRSVQVVTTSESQTGGVKVNTHSLQSSIYWHNLKPAKKEPSFKDMD